MTSSPCMHYDTLAQHYLPYWSFEESYQNDLIAKMHAAIQLTSDSVLVDLGGGSGNIGQLLAESGNLTTWYCVDPSEKMFHEAEQRGITVWEGDCHSFIQQFPFNYDRVLIKSTIHHVHERRSFFRALQQRHANSPSPIKVLIITRPKHTGWPLFERVRVEWAKEQPSQEELLQECQTGVPWRKLETYTVAYPIAIPRDRWYSMLRGRFLSNLRTLSNAEIEAGIKELEDDWKNNNDQQDDMVHFTDDHIFIELDC